MNTNRAEDQARLAGRPASSQQAAEPDATVHEAGAEQQPAAAPPRIGRRWSVRIHWGIVFAIVASLVLWFAIKTMVGLVF